MVLCLVDMSMLDLSTIYDGAFFAEWGRSNDAYVSSVSIIVDVLTDYFDPRRIVDLGCGSGVYGHFFSRRDIEVVSIKVKGDVVALIALTAKVPSSSLQTCLADRDSMSPDSCITSWGVE